MMPLLELPEEEIRLAQQAPVGEGIEIDEDVGISRAAAKARVRSISSRLPASAFG